MRRRLHRYQTYQLQEVVLHHIAQGAAFIIIAGALPYPDRFGYGNLHMVDSVIIPLALKNHIGKAQRHQILNGLFTQIMINTIDLIFTENRPNFLADFFC